MRSGDAAAVTRCPLQLWPAARALFRGTNFRRSLRWILLSIVAVTSQTITPIPWALIQPAAWMFHWCLNPLQEISAALFILICFTTTAVFHNCVINCALQKETRLVYLTKHSCLGTLAKCFPCHCDRVPTVCAVSQGKGGGAKFSMRRTSGWQKSL
jgi:hypothetical protein